jgi:hypothetical protein
MSKKIGRPAAFDAARQETFCTLVGVGLSRRQAADHVGIAASTATRCAERDETFADALRKAEMRFHVDLMEKLRRQSERSWRACVWLLEHSYPETYGRGKANDRPGLTVDRLFDEVVMLLEEIPDEALRARLTNRLDRLAVEEFQPPATDEPEAEVAAPREIPAMSLPEHVAVAGEATSSVAPSHQPESRPEPRPQRSDDRSKRRRAQHRRQGRPLSPKARLIDELLAAAPAKRPPSDFCNTSPSAHERRLLQELSA